MDETIKVNTKIIYVQMFALPRIIVACCRSRSQDRGIRNQRDTLPDIWLEFKARRRKAPANLDSKRRWEILRERCDVYPCVPWKHGKLCRSGVAVFRLIPPIDTDAETTTKTRIRVSQRWRNCCFIPCASHTASKSRQIVCLEIDGKSHAWRNFESYL